MDLNIKNTDTKVKLTSTEIENKANFTPKSNKKAVVKETIVKLG